MILWCIEKKILHLHCYNIVEIYTHTSDDLKICCSCIVLYPCYKCEFVIIYKTFHLKRQTSWRKPINRTEDGAIFYSARSDPFRDIERCL